MTDELPMSPEAWRDAIQAAADATGHEAEVIVAVESTMSGWKVTVNPVTSAGRQQQNGPSAT